LERIRLEEDIVEIREEEELCVGRIELEEIF
jgi:hypothetical protein